MLKAGQHSETWACEPDVAVSSAVALVILCVWSSKVVFELRLSDVQKFPLRMKDNDLLVTELYRDPNEDAITALSVYLTPKTSRQLCTAPRLAELLLHTAEFETCVLGCHERDVSGWNVAQMAAWMDEFKIGDQSSL